MPLAPGPPPQRPRSRRRTQSRTDSIEWLASFFYGMVQIQPISGNSPGRARLLPSWENKLGRSLALPGLLPGFEPCLFYSYLIEKQRPTDPAVVEQFKTALKAAADREIGYLKGTTYPVGTPMNLRWWGSNTAQGQYAFPCLLQWSLTKEQKYIDAACQLMDYDQGLNPIGKCYMCGLGFNRVYNPHDRESAYTKSKGWGPRPGILVFGGLYHLSGVDIYGLWTANAA